MKTLDDWKASLCPLLEQRGRSWERLSADCEQIILFGSRAAGVSEDASDFDVLCIGSGQTHRSPALDLIVVSVEECHSQRWWGRELAGHVARYGVWLLGEPDWIRQVRYSREAIEGKAQKIRHRLQSVGEHLALLSEPYLDKHAALIRRDLQRYECLIGGVPVPPTPELDQRWRQLTDPQSELLRLAREARVGSEFLLERLGAPERWRSIS